MTNDRFELTVTAWLHEDAAARLPDHLGAVLALTSRTRQRPAWSSLERWLPMDTTLRPALGSVISPGRLVLAGLLVLALVGLLLVAVGSQRRLPEPFGLARNGTFLASFDGDIHTVDPDSGQTTPLVTGDTFDFSPVFARDGSKFLFLRSDGPLGDPAILTPMVANADGSNLHAISEPMPSLDWFDWSPDGSRVAFVSAGDIYVADSSGGSATRLDNPRPAHFVTWLPPAGDRLLYREETMRPTIVEIGADGTGIRAITPTGATRTAYQGLSVAPDGQRISYTRRVDDLPQAFVLEMASGAETQLPNADGVKQLGGVVFSPDGADVAYIRVFRDGGYQVVVAPSDGSDAGKTLGPRMAPPPEGTGISVWTIFAPDGASLIVRYGDDDNGSTYLLPIEGLGQPILGSGTFQFVDVQRLAR